MMRRVNTRHTLKANETQVKERGSEKQGLLKLRKEEEEEAKKRETVLERKRQDRKKETRRTKVDGKKGQGSQREGAQLHQICFVCHDGMCAKRNNKKPREGKEGRGRSGVFK